MSNQKQRKAARSVAIEMASEGMGEGQVRKELEDLELHHLISKIEISEIVSKHKPKFKFWFPIYHLKRQILGGFVTAGCVFFLLHTLRVYLANEGGIVLAPKGIVYCGFGLIAGLWLIFKPEEAEDDLF